MARRPADAKTRSLKEHGCLNPHAETVRDELFLSNGFFDPRDLLQVRYEMLRRVREDGVPVSHAAASFGVSRPTWYQAQRAYEAGGLPDRPGRVKDNNGDRRSASYSPFAVRRDIPNHLCFGVGVCRVSLLGAAKGRYAY